MNTVRYLRNEYTGHRLRTNPRTAMGIVNLRVRRGLHGLGDASAICLDQNQNSIPCSSPDCTYGDCGSAGPQQTSGSLCLDQNQNQISCSDADCTYGDCTSGAKSASPSSGGAPSGSLLVYQGKWQVSATLNANTIISRVVNALRTYGLAVVNMQNDAGALTLTSFNVSLTLQVQGDGFAQPSDAGSIVDHAYYTVTGHMPVFSSTVLQSSPGSTSLFPASTPTAAVPQSTSQWLQSNAWWLVLAGVAAIALPRMLD